VHATSDAGTLVAARLLLSLSSLVDLPKDSVDLVGRSAILVAITLFTGERVREPLIGEQGRHTYPKVVRVSRQ